MGVTICPPDHKHAETGSCYRWHKCKCDPCRGRQRERAREGEPFRRKQRILDGKDVRVSGIGSSRRLQGLAVVGWSATEIANRLGAHGPNIGRIRRGDAATVQRGSALAIERLTKELVDQKPPKTRHTVSVQNYARRFGWVSVLAWDDIDDPLKKPRGVSRKRKQ